MPTNQDDTDNELEHIVAVCIQYVQVQTRMGLLRTYDAGVSLATRRSHTKCNTIKLSYQSNDKNANFNCSRDAAIIAQHYVGNLFAARPCARAGGRGQAKGGRNRQLLTKQLFCYVKQTSDFSVAVSLRRQGGRQTTGQTLGSKPLPTDILLLLILQFLSRCVSIVASATSSSLLAPPCHILMIEVFRSP